MNKTLLVIAYACTIFLGAFLLFQVQPIIGKMILPWFGGSAAVWSTCLLFFQVLLLFGYLYAHWTGKLPFRNQAFLHIFLLACSLALLPVTPDHVWKPNGESDPTWRIIALMTATVGLPYFLLSTTGPLLQSWFAREQSGTVPYRLFALSNLGSMLGLLSYPVLFEPRLSMQSLSSGWSATYAAFAAICAALAWHASKLPIASDPLKPEQQKSGWECRMTWVALAAWPAVMLMAVTSHLTQNVAPVPFLWVLPLSLYLLSFILCFESERWYRRSWYLPLFLVWFVVMNIDLIKPFVRQGVIFPIALYCSGLFIACMVCHGELSRRKPPPSQLTSFYLMIALGGALGGLFVAIIAPRIFNNNYEMPISIIAIALLILSLLAKDPQLAAHRTWGRRIGLKLTAVAVGLVSVMTTAATARQVGSQMLVARNFYGTLQVEDAYTMSGMERQLVHGAILHGSQNLDPERRMQPTTYYGPNSGVAMAISATRELRRPQRIGIVGLGTGTLAAYGRDGDEYRFYEINPLVISIAHSQFTFLSDSRAAIATVLGDARLSLEREPAQGFDVLAVDAFSGDSIPVHLLTREAFQVYFSHVRPGGILAIHVSNKNLDLTPVVKHAADYFGKYAKLVDTESDQMEGWNGSTWILLSDSHEVFANEEIWEAASDIAGALTIPAWTDDYSSIFPILK